MDSLLENTTYSFNFGESIEDNNEGNKLSDFRYVFSTTNSEWPYGGSSKRMRSTFVKFLFLELLELANKTSLFLV